MKIKQFLLLVLFLNVKTLVDKFITNYKKEIEQTADKLVIGVRV